MTRRGAGWWVKGKGIRSLGLVGLQRVQHGLGVVRSTFLISPDGRIAQAWRGVKVPGHAQAVLDALKAHQAQ